MKKPRSYVIFTDGHEEEVLHCERKGPHIMFTTKSGVYILAYDLEPVDYAHNRPFNKKIDLFFRIRFDVTPKDKYPQLSFEQIGNIASVVIDERVPYKYDLDLGGRHISGTVLIPPDVTEDKIKIAIIDDLNREDGIRRIQWEERKE